MRRNELDYFLGLLLEHDQNVSDIIITVGRPMQAEINGELSSVPMNPAIEYLTPFQTEMIALNLIGGSKRLTEDLLRSGSCDTSYTLGDRARFRVNVFSQRGAYSVVLRKLNAEVPSFQSLLLPEVILEATKEKTGLILVTGATGSGKTTTLASLINEMNAMHPIHIITLEDPVEFIYEQNLATINQRELGTDFDNFSNGLRAALRQAPKVILVGEMRDRATVEIALSAAETGHLVFSTLHTIDAGQTVNRILGMFDQEEQDQVRIRLSDTLRWAVWLARAVLASIGVGVGVEVEVEVEVGVGGRSLAGVALGRFRRQGLNLFKLTASTSVLRTGIELLARGEPQ